MTTCSDARKSQLQLMKHLPCFNSFGKAGGIGRSEMSVYRKGDGIVQWNLERISSPDARYALLLLNNERCVGPHFDVDAKFLKLWSNAAIRIAVDGGTNNLPRDPKFKPDIITGDLDSIDQEAVHFFQKLGSRIIPTPDQDQTDFTKAVQIVLDEKDLNVEYVLALSSISGRPDHSLSNFHTLFLFVRKIPIILLDVGVSVSFALESGVRHVIASPTDASSWCSLVPLIEPSVLTTTGLKWNLAGQLLTFGQFISTSNEFATSSGHVEVECSSCVLWSMKDSNI